MPLSGVGGDGLKQRQAGAAIGGATQDPIQLLSLRLPSSVGGSPNALAPQSLLQGAGAKGLPGIGTANTASAAALRKLREMLGLSLSDPLGSASDQLGTPSGNDPLQRSDRGRSDSDPLSKAVEALAGGRRLPQNGLVSVSAAAPASMVHEWGEVVSQSPSQLTQINTGHEDPFIGIDDSSPRKTDTFGGWLNDRPKTPTESLLGDWAPSVADTRRQSPAPWFRDKYELP